jgi:putative MFS transporter
LLFTIDLLAIIVFSVAQFFVDDPFWLIVVRFCLGVVVGADYPIATSLLAEFSPRRYRGSLLGAFVSMWFVGAAVAYVVGTLLLTVDGGWRWMLASAAVPAVVIVLARLGIPESPRWLVKAGRTAEADDVLRTVFGPQASAADLPAEPHENLGVGALLTSGYGRRMWFVTVFWTCSIIPLFGVYAFAPRILDALDLDGPLQSWGDALVTVLFLLGCVLACYLVDHIGRRTLITYSFVLSGVALALLGLFSDPGWGLITALFAAYAVFIGGAQILQWIYPNELFPTEIRGSAVGLASSLSRIGAAIGTYLVPPALSGLGVGPTLTIGGLITLIGAAVSASWAPETRGLTLSEAASLSTGTTPAAAIEAPGASTPV